MLRGRNFFRPVGVFFVFEVKFLPREILYTESRESPLLREKINRDKSFQRSFVAGTRKERSAECAPDQRPSCIRFAFRGYVIRIAGSSPRKSKALSSQQLKALC